MKKLINKIKEKLGEMPKSEKVVLILILLFFGIIHLYIRPVFCDDVNFVRNLLMRIIKL